MSGPPNWNPRLQTSSVRFPRKAVETPQIPPNTTARPRPGAPFQPVYPNPITQIPAITAEVTGCGKILDSLYLLNNGTGEAVPYNVTRQTLRGVPIPEVITVATAERYIVFGINFPYRMSGTDHFVFTFTNQSTNEQTIKNYQPAAQYLVSGLEPGIVYILTVSPYVNGITYPASPPTDPFAISAISEKNVELQGVTLSGGDRSAAISFAGAIPGPPIALAVSNIAIDDNFINYQLRCNLGPSPPRPVNTGTVVVGNLTNGSSYTFTVTPYAVTDGIFEYGRPTTLPPYIPGPPSDLYINSITANTTTAFLNTMYDTLVHPTPVSNIVDIWESTFTTLCSLVSLPSTTVRDLSQTYAGFTTLSSLFTPADISNLKTTVSAKPGFIQVDITDNTGLWYSFPLDNVSGGGIGYVFENSNFTKTQSLYTTASSSYTLLFRQVTLGTQICSQVFSPPQTAFTYNGVLNKTNHTFIGRNFANGLPSLRTAYATVAVGEPLFPTNITGVSGNHIVSISFTGYNPSLAIPGPKPTFFRYSDNYGNTYTTINSNIVINGLTNSSLYTFTIAGFGNGVYGNTAQYSITPGVRPPTSLSVLAVSNYDVTLSFSPGLGGADFYAVVTQNGLAQSASAYPYKIQNLSADVSYTFGALSFAYASPVYSILSSVSSNLIREVSSSYAQFLISPSGFPYASNIQQGITEFVPYLYTITASGQSPAPSTVNVTNSLLANIFPVGTSLYASNSISTIALVQSGISAGSAYTVTTSGVSYTLTSIGVSGGYYVLNGGPSTLISLSGQILSLSITPISNTLTFPITSVTSVYDGSGNITAYNIQNPSSLKSRTTFSGATVYRTTISAIIPFYDGMTPTTFVGTVSSSTFTPAGQIPTFVGPPGTVIFTASSYSSQRVDLEVAVSGYVTPVFYSYAEVSGKIVPGTSASSPIAITGLTNGSSYTFSVSAFGNQVYGPSAQTIRFDLCTNAPRNVVASFFNVTPFISYQTSVPAATSYVSELYNPTNGNRLIQTLTQASGGTFQFPNTVDTGAKYNFRTYGILNGISSTACNITGIIAGPPFQPIPKTTVLSSGQIVFTWSSGNTDYSEKFRITEYLSNDGVFPTGGVWSNISGFTYTVSAVVTASGTQAFATSSWIEVSPGYASFVLSNDPYSFLSTINNTYRSNQIYLTLQQSGGVSYTFPLTNIADYNSQSNIYTNPNYPKDTTDIFNPALTLSVTYSYGTGPFNYGKYLYTLDSFANQVYGLSAERTAQMFVQPVIGIPTVSVSGTAATVSFAQTAITGSVYRVTNNYGSNVSAAPYTFTNLSTGRPYTFSVVVSNGTFVSISSASSIPIYVGPPSAPTVSTSYYGQTSTIYVTDTTLSLASVFFDTGKQGTGSNVATISHTNVIQQSSGGFWVGTIGSGGGIKDTSSGFVSADLNIGSAAYSNDGVANAMYQFTVTPSTGTIAVSLSSYSLFISGTALAVSNGSARVYSATVTASSYPIQFVSRSTAFGIQSGLSSFFYTSVPASSDLLTISLGGAASFSDYRVYSLNNVGVPASSYTITDQYNTVYNPSLAYTVYSLSGITYAYNLFNVSQNTTFTLSVRPFGNGIQGSAGTASLYINTETPIRPIITSLVNTSATVTLQGVQSIPPVETYSLIEYENGNAKSTQTQPAAYSPYAVPGLSMWLDAADPATYTYQTGSTTTINSWTDKTTNGYIFTQAPVTAGAITTSIQNGKTAINMGANVMTIPNFTWYTQFTTFFVVKSDNWFYNGGGVTAQNTNFYTGYVLSGNWNLIFTPGAGATYDPSYGTPGVTQVSSVIPNQWCIFSIGYGGGTQAANYAVNGTPRSTNAGLTPTGQSATSTPLYLNGRWDYAAGNTQVGEIIHYSRSVTTQERQSIEGYLAYKWGLTSSFATPPTLPATPTTYTFRYPSLTNHSKYYFKGYATRFGVSSELSDASQPEREAGNPYPFPASGLTASLLNPNPTTGNYTLSATLNVGANSNGDMTVFVFSGNTQVTSKTVTITTSADQQYSFTVSGGARYTLSSSALMNSVTVVGPTTTISAFPFRPLAVSLTISTANLGSTYGGIINVTTPSPTTGVTYYYAYSSNNGATVTNLSTTNTFSATYGLSYVGYVYSCNVSLGLLSTASAATIACNVFLSSPTNAVATYNGTNITVNWSGNSTGSLYYTVRETGGKLGTQTNISAPLLTTTFVGTTGSSYTFEVAAQSDISSGLSNIYSTFTPTATISLATLSAAPVTIDYYGSSITLNWTNRGAGYVYTVSQMIGPSLGNFNQPTTNTKLFEGVPTFYTYQFAVSTSLNGISGGISFSPSVTLSTGALTNVSQSYIGNLGGTVSYTISWNTYTPLRAGDTSIPNYIVRDSSGKTFEVSGTPITSFTTTDTSAAFTLARTVSSYTFQVNASYKGILGPVTTLSAIYMYVNAPPSAPTTTYSDSNITVTWLAAAQPDGNSRPDTYTVYDTIGRTLSSNVTGISNSVILNASVGLSYQFTVTSIYKGITSPTGLCGEIIRLFTPSPTNVLVRNEGSNLVINWTSSVNSPTATYAIRQTQGPEVMPAGFSNVGTATSYTSPNAVTTLSDKIFYNFEVLALSNSLSSIAVSGNPAFVYTYPVTNVFIYYSNVTLFAGWTPNTLQPNATFNATAYLKDTTTTVGSVNTAPGATSVLIISNATSNSSYYARVFARNNNLQQSEPTDTRSTYDVTLFTAPPIFNGIGFNGNYAITANMSSGPAATTDRLRNADTYTLTEINNLFFPNASSWTFRPTEVYTIPTLGTQGLTYNFSLYATLCGLTSIVTTSGTIQLRLITNPVPANTVVADYFGTTVTISWGKAAQNNVGDTNSDPNGGYTIYVSSQANALTTLYPNRSFQFIGGIPGSNYQFYIGALNNNVGSSLTTGASAVVTLYKPVVQFLNVTNSGQVTASGNYYAKMILTWLPDSISTTDVTYTGTAFNRGTGRIEGTDTTTSNTLTFNGSLGYTYDLTVTGRYKGINGNSSTVQISNARPILTVEPLVNIGDIIIVNYSANEAFSSFDVSARATNGGSVVCNIVTTSSFASWRVTTSTGGFGYSVSTTAFFNGIPSTTIGRTITLTEPAAPASITFRYNNALVSVSWSPVTTNASSYTFTAYDLSADPPILASSQPGLLATSTSFLGILGHTYNVSAFALSSNNITSRGTGTTATLVIPPAPAGSLVLSNAGTIVSVSWTTSAGYGYAFYVSNEAQRGTIIYSNLFALPGDTFSGVIGQTYSVSLFQISPSNVTSVGSIANTWKVYQPSIPFVSFTNIGRDNTVTWPQDVEGSNCVFRLADNYLYSNLLFPDPANYTGPSNGWAVGNVGSWFSPKDLPGCTLWLDANDPNATGVPAANGTTISTWRDKSGLGCNATAAALPSTTQYTTPTNTICNVPDGAISSTIIVTVIGGGGGGGSWGAGASGGIATYTFTGVTPGTQITYYVGSGGACSGGWYGLGGSNSYVTIGSTTIYAGGGGGGGPFDGFGGNGVGQFGGIGQRYPNLASNGGISSIATSGTRIQSYGNGGAANGNGSDGIVVITMVTPSLPAIISTGLNSRPTMNFNGGSYFTGPTANTTSNLTVFAVMMLPGNAANNSRIVSLATPTKVDYDTYAEVLALQQSFTKTWISTGRNTRPPTGGTDTFISSTDYSTTSNVPYIAVARYSASLTQTLFVNGSAKATGATTGAFGYTTYGIGNYANAPSASEPFTGKISEVLIYSNALTPVQRAQVENYLSQKWAINVSSTALTHASSYSAYNVTANYTQVGNYISYTVTTPADDTGANNTGRSYIYSVIPSWNGTNGNTVYTDTGSPIQLFKPTTPGGLGATGQGSSFTLNWQSAVIWTSPATIIPSYLLQVAPTTATATYPTQSFNVIGNTQTVNGFDSSAGTLTISLAAVTPLGYTNPIYGNPAVLTYTVPSGTSVSITQSTINAETLIVTVPLQLLGAQRTWFFITGTGRGGASTAVVSNFQTYKSSSSNYDINISLGYNYTISAAITSSTTSPPSPADPSAPANPNPFPAKTLKVSGITVTHDACTVTLNWLSVSGAEYYNVYSANNGQKASTGFGRGNIPATTTSISITNNGGTPTQQFAANEKYSYVIQSVTLSTNRFNPATNTVLSTNIESDFASSLPVTMYIPTNPTVAQLILTQSFSNIIASWPALTSYPQDNAADTGTASYTISCTSFTSTTTTGTTATFGSINPGTLYTILLNTKYKGFWGATPTTTTFQTTAPTITSGPTLTDTGLATIRVTASAETAGFWYLVDGTTETLMNSSPTGSSNQITYTFASTKATTYTRRVKFVTQDTGLSVTSGPVSVSTPNLVVSTPTTADAGATRKFSITLAYTGTPTGGIVWDVATPTGTTFVSGNTTTNPTTLTYQFTNAAWSTNLSATFTSIVLSNDGFTFPYAGANPTFTAPNLNIPTPTLANSGGTLVLAAYTTGGCNVTWTYPSYTTLGGGGSTTTTALSVNYGAISATGTTYSPNAALSLAFNGYTNSASLPSFTAPTFSIGTVTFADPNVGTKIIRLTANYGTYSPGTTGGTTTPQWTFPSTTSNGGGYYQLSASAPFTSTNSPATLDYSTTQNGSNYAIAANQIALSYQGVSITYGSLLTASTPNIALTVNGTYSGTTLTVNPINAGGVAGSWSLGAITPPIPSTTLFYTTPDSILTIPGGAPRSTFTVTVIGGGGGGGAAAALAGVGGGGGGGAVATRTFTGIEVGTAISYFVGRGGSGGVGGAAMTAAGGGNYSYITVGTTTIFAAGGGGGGGGGSLSTNGTRGTNGASGGGGAVGGSGGAGGTTQAGNRNGVGGESGTISTNASPGTRITTYGNGGGVGVGVGGGGVQGVVSISYENAYTITQSPANPTAAPTITITPATVGTTYTVPVNFSYNSGQFTSTGSTSITVTDVTGTATIGGVTFTYATANDNTPNGFNVVYTVAGFTGTVALGCTTLVTLDQNYNNFSPRIEVTSSVNNANVQKGTINPNVVYQLNAAQLLNGNLGSLSTRNAVFPGAVTNVIWGSAAGSSDKSLSKYNTIYISWTPISPNSTIASQFTYTIYSIDANTNPPTRPSTTVPTGATGYTGYPCTQSNVEFEVANGSFRLYVGTVYTDPGTNIKWYSPASSVITFTYGSASYSTYGNSTFRVANANTFVNAYAVGGGGAGGGYGLGSCTGGGSGGLAKLEGWRGLQYNDVITIDGPGRGGAAGVTTTFTSIFGAASSLAVGGNGGARGDGSSTPVGKDLTGAQVSTTATGAGNGGGARSVINYFGSSIINAYPNGAAGGGGGLSKLAVIRNNQDVFILAGSGGAGGGTYDGGGNNPCYGGNGGGFSLVAGGDGSYYTFPTTGDPRVSGGGGRGYSGAVGTITAGNNGAGGGFYPDHWNGGYGGSSVFNGYGYGGNGGSQTSQGVVALTGGAGGDGVAILYLYYIVPS
jgi:hypothetical protein